MADREELLARLLADPAFRAEFQRDPDGVARRLGLDGFAGGGDPPAGLDGGGRRLGLDGFAADGDPLEALDGRESRSSLAGVLFALAAEGVAFFALADHADAAPGPQYGMGAAAHAPPEETVALLHSHNVTSDADGIADLQAGRIDPRVVAVLTDLSHDHRITVSAMCSDHPQNTTGGSVSNHFYGRAVDIATIDGRPVGPGNAAAKAIAVALSRLDPSIRPTEIGSPWSLSGAAYFTDAEHQNHLHIGFDDPLAPGWNAPPGDETALPDQHPSAGAAAALEDDEDDEDDGDGGGDDDEDDGGDDDSDDDEDDDDDEVDDEDDDEDDEDEDDDDSDED